MGSVMWSGSPGARARRLGGEHEEKDSDGGLGVCEVGTRKRRGSSFQIRVRVCPDRTIGNLPEIRRSI